MAKLSNYCIRYMYRLNGQLETKVLILDNQATPLNKIKEYAKREAEQNGWRLLDVTRLSHV